MNAKSAEKMLVDISLSASILVGIMGEMNFRSLRMNSASDPNIIER